MTLTQLADQLQPASKRLKHGKAGPGAGNPDNDFPAPLNRILSLPFLGYQALSEPLTFPPDSTFQLILNTTGEVSAQRLTIQVKGPVELEASWMRKDLKAVLVSLARVCPCAAPRILMSLYVHSGQMTGIRITSQSNSNSNRRVITHRFCPNLALTSTVSEKSRSKTRLVMFANLVTYRRNPAPQPIVWHGQGPVPERNFDGNAGSLQGLGYIIIGQLHEWDYTVRSLT